MISFLHYPQTIKTFIIVSNFISYKTFINLWTEDFS